ncbi:MAG: hypothetical protein GY719_03980 [bacterium]|nr:hypothetical protein [bacterium]
MRPKMITLALLATLLLSAGLATGCASKKDLTAAQTALAECNDEKLGLEASVISWEQRFDRESSRWMEIESSVTEALPAALQEFHAERERIVELVPEQVQSEVGAYLEDYFGAVMKGFGKLAEDNAEIKTQLRVTHRALEAVGADTREIGNTIDETVAEERAERQAAQARRQARDERIATRMAEIVDQVVEFDQNRINCRDCPDRLKLNRKERETMLAFHAELIADLADLQRFAGEVPAVLDEESAAEGD